MQDNIHKKQVLTPTKIARIIKRLAYQVYERNYQNKQLSILGVNGQGMILSEMISKELKSIDKNVTIHNILVNVNKINPAQSTWIDREILKDYPILLVDDVIYTGHTLMYCLGKLLEYNVPSIEMAVLIERGHRKYPLTPTYFGYQLATTLEEHVEVCLQPTLGVYLY